MLSLFRLQHFCPDVPALLVGTKLDLRNDPMMVEKVTSQGQSIISTEKGLDLAKKIKAIKYLECSAKTQENLKLVFDEAVKSVLFTKRKKQRCALL